MITMRKTIMIAAAAMALAACQESLDDRAAREAREFTEKNCPVQISEAITTDSLTFDKQTKTLHYYLSVRGVADTTAIAGSDVHADMIKSLKGNTSVRAYKEAGYNFMYTFFSTKHSGKKLYEINITKQDYNN